MIDPLDKKPSTILVTGSAGFIGANFVLAWLQEKKGSVISLDKLTYAGNLANLESVQNDTAHIFVQGDIADKDLLNQLLDIYQPWAIINFAAETHVDRSILSPEDFVTTNVTGTLRLLEATRTYLNTLPDEKKSFFRFLHVSTDEVYGSLGASDPAFTEIHPARPNSPYAASKAASDHLVRAYHHTFGLPTLTTHCSNNYGAFQFPEKLIPHMITQALGGKPLPLYGDGQNVRDWIYVEDHCSALRTILHAGRVGETYNIGGNTEASNSAVVHILCDILDRLRPLPDRQSYHTQITYVEDRPGHDRRYAINAHKVRSELGWSPQHSFAEGIEKTVKWYLDHQSWLDNVTTGAYRQWVETNYQSGLRA